MVGFISAIWTTTAFAESTPKESSKPTREAMSRGYAGDGGLANEAKLNQPYELAWDKSHNLYFVEVGNHCVRRIDAKSRIITTVAGTGKAGFAGDDGPAIKAQFNQPHSLAFDASGHLFVCDILNHRIRKIDLATGTITTWAGTGERKTAADGSPIQGSPLNGPRAIAFARDGKCWLALREGNAVLLLDPEANEIKRIAGTGKSGFTGNGGPAIRSHALGSKMCEPRCEGQRLSGGHRVPFDSLHRCCQGNP
jgi:sugar lactone lactonase YvrE